MFNWELYLWIFVTKILYIFLLPSPPPSPKRTDRKQITAQSCAVNSIALNEALILVPPAWMCILLQGAPWSSTQPKAFWEEQNGTSGEWQNKDTGEQRHMSISQQQPRWEDGSLVGLWRLLVPSLVPAMHSELNPQVPFCGLWCGQQFWLVSSEMGSLDGHNLLLPLSLLLLMKCAMYMHVMYIFKLCQYSDDLWCLWQVYYKLPVVLLELLPRHCTWPALPALESTELLLAYISGLAGPAAGLSIDTLLLEHFNSMARHCLLQPDHLQQQRRKQSGWISGCKLQKSFFWISGRWWWLWPWKL